LHNITVADESFSGAAPFYSCSGSGENYVGSVFGLKSGLNNLSYANISNNGRKALQFLPHFLFLV
jgi:hypothetical protein